MKELLILTVFLVFKVLETLSATISWNSDQISLTAQLDQGVSRTGIEIQVSSNGMIFDGERGNFKLNVEVINKQGLQFIGQTDCIFVSTTVPTLQRSLNNLRLYFLDSKGNTDLDTWHRSQDLFFVDVKRFFYRDDYSAEVPFQTTLQVGLTKRTNATQSVNVTISQEGCSSMRTVGEWSDYHRWSGQVVPTEEDDVVFLPGAGVATIDTNITIHSLNMSGGTIINYKTYCPPGWSVEPDGYTGIKCYKLFENPSPFEAAERICNAKVGLGSENRHLVHIRNRAELLTSMRMCRGAKGTDAHSKGCWIGLQDRLGTGEFTWISPLAVGGTDMDNGMFLDWRRDEPNNHSISEGVPAQGGERCAALVPWQEDPLVLEQGSWNDDSCTVSRPFVCQTFGDTQRFALTVTHSLLLTAGTLEGGVLVSGSGTAELLNFEVERGGRIEMPSVTGQPTASFACVLGTVLLEDGASLVLHNNAITVSNAYIGETRNVSAMTHHSSSSYLAMQPFVQIDAGSTVTMGAYCPTNNSPSGCTATNSNVTINARAFVEGILDVDVFTEVSFLQGAEMSSSSVDVADGTSQLVFSGYSSRLSSYDAYELVVANRGEVVGEFYRDFDKEEANDHQGVQQGVYRLRLTASSSSSLPSAPTNISACIPYNATAAELTTLLNSLQIVHKRGGVTVRRYGSPTDPKYRYGYTYRIEMDSVTTSMYQEGSLTMKVECYGFDDDCGCAETKVQMVDAAGVPQCPAANTNRSSLVQTDACVFPPNISISTISSLAYTATSGTGAIEVREGVHRFPPVTNECTMAVKAGTGVVASDVIDWTALSITGMGRLVAAGTGWDAWDSTYALYGPEWATKRGEIKALGSASPFDMTVQRFYLDGLGSMLASCPRSNISWTSGTWAGGIIGGRAHLHITDSIAAMGTGKSLRYGLTMMIDAGATMTWTAGNLSLADGADLIVEGSLNVDTSASGVGVFVGMAQLLRAPIADSVAQKILYQEPTRNWHSYYGDELPSELRGGWYQNPLCGDQCLVTNHLIVRSNGAVNAASNAKVTFSLPLDLIGESRMNIGSSVELNLASGGICGNQVIIDIGSGTTLSLSGGQMSMEAFCTIQGDGELLVVAGSHDLAFSIDAHITIEGGSMVWPLSRGNSQTISFNGGLLVQKTGELIVNPFSTTIQVFKEVHLKDQSLLQFPLIGIAAQASLFDAQNAPDSSPRGILISNGTMRWEGGTLRGKADFNAELELFLDGDTKYIQSLAKLVNKGHCEWGTGDLISSDSGDFLNLGTVQMKSGVTSFSSNAMYQGTELPIENGGDVFALEYHSWDMDNGGLDYREYVKQRTEFVSRAPNGWTKESQNE